ncbi:DUF2141 domain-containing protein [uncultured Aquimonas sp.]|uniref:DUF2141 domain-containing protein n=1 Tax=uncultured Aquimonas sp. TaxID=385483 RepID=UPI00086F98A7|nr:DUF2141 domain-containing protein [uncultured Aquimonas sp.]ODU48040.1 MAG: hypothetical protein ABS96_01530 [Xanthomonadaceae bacterium SCN 69-123]
MSTSSLRLHWVRASACLALLSAASLTAAATLEVEITDIRSSEGQLMVAVHASAEGWDGKAAPVAAQLHAPSGERALLSFEGLAPGSYAVQVMHDQNGNGALDSNFMGMPIEGYGFSNNPEVMRKATFDEARIEVGEGGTRIQLRLR